MSNRDRDFLTRTESKKRSNRTQGRKKLDRLLNVLIAIVAVLILINLYFVFSNNGEKAQEVEDIESEQTSSDTVSKNEQDSEQESNSSEEDSTQSDSEDTESNSNNDSNNSTSPDGNKDNSTTNEPSDGKKNDEEDETKGTIPTSGKSVVVQDSDDPLVDQVMFDPNWAVTPTKQTGTHISTYSEGHIDYEEKKVTIRNAVGLEEDNIIYWSIRNNGSNETSISVVSSMDKKEKYRVSIEWIANEGWKPVKVEMLNTIEGTY
ncbi:hypothetical protein UACE39S_06859 [Ureibacillus acetophenoni]